MGLGNQQDLRTKDSAPEDLRKPGKDFNHLRRTEPGSPGL